jgi:hypothetical protein
MDMGWKINISGKNGSTQLIEKQTINKAGVTLNRKYSYSCDHCKKKAIEISCTPNDNDVQDAVLTLILLTWEIRWAPKNASKWQMGFNSVFKGLRWEPSGQRKKYFQIGTNMKLVRSYRQERKVVSLRLAYRSKYPSFHNVCTATLWNLVVESDSMHGDTKNGATGFGTTLPSHTTLFLKHFHQNVMLYTSEGAQTKFTTPQTLPTKINSTFVKIVS